MEERAGVKGGTVEERMASIEGEVRQINLRIGDLRSDMNHRFEAFNRRLEEVREEIRELRNRFWWLLGIQITMWVTIILAILFGR